MSDMVDNYISLCAGEQPSIDNKWANRVNDPHFSNRFSHHTMKIEEIINKYVPTISEMTKIDSNKIEIQVDRKNPPPCFKYSHGLATAVSFGGYAKPKWENVGETICTEPEKDWWETNNWSEGTYRIIYTENDEFSKKTWADPHDSFWPDKNHELSSIHNVIASFKLYRMPHCCGILVSCDSYVYPAFQFRGLGTLLNNLRQDIGKYLGYSLILCTDKENNYSQRTVLKKNEWKDIFDFHNRKSGNKVVISVKEL